MSTTPNFEFPYILPSQAQKHVTHNEAIAVLDALVHLTIQSGSLVEPPEGAVDGDCYVVAADASGDWTGRSGSIAWRDGNWRFLAPRAGMIAWWAGDASLRIFDGTAWQMVTGTASGGGETSRFDRIAINAPLDPLNRLAVSGDATLFSHETADHRLAISKASADATASVVFQNGFSGRAEFGLAGDDNFSVKVSADGETWRPALEVDGATGRIHAPAGLAAPGQMLRTVVDDLRMVFSTNLATPVATGLSVTLTPASAQSTFLVRASLCVGADFWRTSPRISVFRNGSKVWPATAGIHVEHQALADTEPNSALVSLAVPVEFQDAPQSADPVTWDVRLASTTAGYNTYLNRRHYSAALRGESNMSVTEIAG